MILHKAGMALSEVAMFPSDSTKKGRNVHIPFRSSELWRRKIQRVYKFIFVWWLSSIAVFVVRRLSAEFNLHRRQITVLYFRKLIRYNYEFLTEFCLMNPLLHVGVWSWRSFNSLTNCFWSNWRCTVRTASSARLYGVECLLLPLFPKP
jgi:hypothetical protein